MNLCIYQVASPAPSNIYRGTRSFHLDLSKIVSVSDITFENMMGHGGNYVSFEIVCQLVDKPLRVAAHIEYTSQQHENGSYTNNDTTPEYEVLNKIRLDLLDAWKKYLGAV